MVESRSNARHCHRVWLAGVILLLASFYLYLSQPMDSASGNLEAFSKDGFTVGWIIQPHRTELRAGDIIQQIEGQPINQWFKSGFGTISGSQTITYSVNRHGESIQLEVLQTPIDLKKNTMVLWIGLAAGLLLMAIGAFLLISLPRKQANRVLMLCCASAAIYLSTNIFGFQASMLQRPWLFWLHVAINQLSYAWMFAASLHLTFVFFPQYHPLYQRFKTPILILVYAISPLLMLAAALAVPDRMGKIEWIDRLGFYTASVQFFLSLIFTLNRIIFDRSQMSYVIRKWLLFGSLFSISLAILSHTVSATYGLPFQAGHLVIGDSYTLLTTETGWLFLMLLPFYLTASIPHRHLLKIDRLLLRSFTYLSAMLLFAALYAALIYLISLLFGYLMPGINPVYLHLAAMFSLLTLFAFGLQSLRTIMEKMLCPTRLHYQRVLPELKSQLQAKLEMERLHLFMSREIPARLESQGASLLVLDPDSGVFRFSGNLQEGVLSADNPLVNYLETNHKAILRFFEEDSLPNSANTFFLQNSIELCIPLIYQKKLIGIYNLGPKKSEMPYTLEEVALLSSLGKPGAIAVENAFSYRETTTRASQMAEEVRQRTVELERAVTESNEDRNAAQQANKVKRIFLHSVSREIRMPMNAIFGMAGLLLNTSLDNYQKELTDSIRNNSSDLLEIINNILEYASIESDNLVLEPQPFILSDFIESVLDLTGPESLRKNVDLSYIIDAHTPVMVTADLGRLTQILYHLLTNAVRFTEAGEISLQVQAKPYGNDKPPAFLRSDEPVYELLFSITDTGEGLANKQVEQVFETEQKEHIEGFQSGAGLGLTISKRLCELMGGKIWVENEEIPEKKSTCSFTILVNASSDTFPAYLDVNQPQLEGKRLLLVQKESADRKISLLQIRSWGIDVTIAESKEEALEKLKPGQTFDLVLLGLDLHGKAISRLGEEIRQNKNAIGLPLVWLVDPQDTNNNTNLDMFDAILTKPVKADQLYNLLIQVFTSETDTRFYHPPENILELLPENHKVEQLPLQILLVEDNPTSQKITSILLENLGYRVDRANNGREALDSLQRQHYDIVFMDIHMPEMNGFEATQTIRKQLRPEYQPYIVALSVVDSPEEHAACRDAGMDDCLLKPVKIGDLVWAIKQAQSPTSRLHQAVQPTEAQGNFQDATPVLDMEVIRRLRNSAGERGDQLVRDITTAYLADAHTLLQEIQQAAQNNQPDDIRRAAHTLRSNSAAVGAVALTEAALKLENTMDPSASSQNKVIAMDNLIEQITAELERYETVLQSIGLETKPSAG